MLATGSSVRVFSVEMGFAVQIFLRAQALCIPLMLHFLEIGVKSSRGDSIISGTVPERNGANCHLNLGASWSF